MDKIAVLQRYFGHDSFRPGQEALVDALLSGRDALGVMPTGAGKSVCYQVPALIFPGLTLVISPLISLMADQVAALKSAGIPAAYLNSSLTPRQFELAMQRARAGAYKIIYVAPERLETPSFLQFAREVDISLLAVDEAHCVSQWGQDFRPVYLRIADFVDQLPRRPVLGAFTATATERVKQDIIRHLRLVNPAQTTTGFDRPNLCFEVVRTKQRDAALMSILKKKQGECGIVYCATRKAVESVCEKLQDAGIPATRYHAGLPDEERRRNQEDFQYDVRPVMVATNAFGMGIDKSNVRFVIHYQMPGSMEAYYQEAGRAGRDGEPSECILLYNGQDIITQRFFIDHSEPNESLTAQEQAAVRRQDLKRLNAMIDYATLNHCLRATILRYFGQQVEKDCGDCSFCTSSRYGEAAGTPEAAPSRPTRSRETKKELPVIKSAAYDKALFEELRSVRLALSKLHHTPPYIICTDATLIDLAKRKPTTRASLLLVSGMGETRAAKYGESFLCAIRNYLMKHQAVTVSALPQPTMRVPSGKAKVAPTRSAPAPTSPRQPSVRVFAPPPEVPPIARPELSDDGEALADAYLSGVTIREMAEELGLEDSEIRERLRNLDLIF